MLAIGSESVCTDHGNGIQIAWNHTVPLTSNLLVVLVGHACAVSGYAGTFSVSYNYEALTQAAVNANTYDGGYFYSLVFYKVNPILNYTGPVIVTGNYGGQFGQGSAAAIDFGGADIVSPLRTASGAHSLSVSPASEAGDYVLDCLTVKKYPAAGGTPGSGQTEIFDYPNNGYGFDHMGSRKAGAATSTAMSWTVSNGLAYAHIGVAVKPGSLRRGGLLFTGA